MQARLIGFSIFLLVFTPFLSSAATLAELQAQLATLMAQLNALQAQTTTPVAPNPSTHGSTTPTSCPNLSRNLSRGMKGGDVTQLQQFLISQKLLAADSATGFYGAMTEAAVKQFQCKEIQVCSGSVAINGYGSVGPKTRTTIALKCSSSVQTPSSNTVASGSQSDSSSPQSSLAPTHAQSPTISSQPTPSNQSCTFNNQTIAHGASVPAYQSASVAYGTRCVSQQRTCNNGTLLGSYTSTTCSVAAPPVVNTDRSWDPGLLHRRAAFYKTSANYFESCPDDAGGCYKNGSGIPIGGGFYTLAPDFGGTTPCAINSGAPISVANSDGTTRSESCPFFFAWTTDTNQKPAAKVTLDSTSWSTTFSPNMYMGFHDQLPQGAILNGSNYFGSKNFPLIDNAHTSVNLSGGIAFPAQDYSRARLLVGISWYVPSLAKEFVVELNLNNAGNLYIEPAWSTTAVATANSACPPQQKCLYLGGQQWGFPAVTSTQTNYVIDWSFIVRKLVEQGHLPSEAYGPYQTSAIYFGPEVLGKAKAELNVSNLRTFVQN